MLFRPHHMPSRLPFRSITSRQNPLVSAFRDAADKPTDELVLIEGARLALEAVRAGWRLTVVAFSEERSSSAGVAALIDARPSETDCVRVSASVLAAISPAATPSGVVALARPPTRRHDPFNGAAPLVIVADAVQDPGNVGAIARVAEAAGATGFLVCGASAHPFGWKALRGSMGSMFRLPIATYVTPTEAIAAVRTRRLRLLALAAHQPQTMYDVDLRGPIALLVGGEGSGLPPEAIEAADATVSVPMAPPVESLNVAVAAGVALYEAARQRAS